MILDQQHAARQRVRLARHCRSRRRATWRPDCGKTSRIVVPTPGIDSICAWPRCRLMIPYTSAKPSPVPALPFVVKNGSNARSRTSADMPMPESRTSSRTSPSADHRAETERSTACHRVERILHEVEQRLADFAGDAAHDRRRARPGRGRVGWYRRARARPTTDASSPPPRRTPRRGRLRSSRSACSGSWRMNRPTRAAVAAPVSAALAMRPHSRARQSGSRRCVSSRYAAAMIGLSALLTSCITPAASWPTAARRRSRDRASCSASSSAVRSCTIRSRRSASVDTRS